MRVAFLHSDKPRERVLADAFLSGARAHGHETFLVPAGLREPEEFDVIAMVGVKSRQYYRWYQRVGAHVVMIDKGYCRGGAEGSGKKWKYWRVSVNSHHPTRFLSGGYPEDRWKALEIEMLPWRSDGKHVLIAGASDKYHQFYSMSDPTTFARQTIKTIRKVSNRDLVYRPKPSWRDAIPIKGSIISRRNETIYDALNNAWAMVTHGSNASFEAMILGIPCIVLGDGITKPISSTSISDIEAPYLATDAERLGLARALAYHQWTHKEFATGEAWELIISEIHS